MTKKIIISLFAAAALFTFGLTACSNKPIAESSQSTVITTTPSATTAGTDSAATTAATTAVGTDATSSTTVATQASTTDQNAVATLAKSLVGCAYKYGKAGPTEFDNSGFLVYCFAQNGITLPRLTRDIVKQGIAVEKSDLQPGDAVFFYNEAPGTAEFAGIYIGDNQFVSSDNEDSPVSIHSMSLSYFVDHYVYARRFSGTATTVAQ